jgi:hypothetical protein
MRTELANRPTLARVEELRLHLDALSAVAAPPPRGLYLKVNSPQEFKGARKAACDFVAQCELNFDASPEFFIPTSVRLFFSPPSFAILPLTGIKHSATSFALVPST